MCSTWIPPHLPLRTNDIGTLQHHHPSGTTATCWPWSAPMLESASVVPRLSDSSA
jgi:hypothetical protein